MKQSMTAAILALVLAISGCTSSDVNYSRALFEHIPDDPELLILVRPNDVSDLVELAVKEWKLQELMDGRLNVSANDLEHYRTVFVQLMESLGIPWQEIENIGVLIYFGKPVMLVSGSFKKEAVVAKMGEIGFNQGESGYFDYVYDKQKLYIAADGLMMMAEEELLDDLASIPAENRLWNREDFKNYRTTSPMDNSIFVWSHPPERMLADFPHREDLGDVSMAVNLRGKLAMKATVRIKDPQKVSMLHNVVAGSVMVASGYFGDDPDYAPVLKGIKVTQDSKQVEASLVITADRLAALKKRVIDDFNNPDAKTFEQIQSFFKTFQ